jgi:H+/Cl- antiporter ClcA
MIPEEFKKWWRRFRALTEVLRDQGVTNLRQLWVWGSSVDVSSQIIAYLRAHPGLQGIVYWVGAICVGLFAVFYARLFEQVFLIPHWILEHKPWVLFILSPACFVLSWWLVKRFASGAAGGGIPEVMVAIEVDSDKASIWAGWRAGAVKFLSSLAAVLGGGAIGREGPTIQIAAAIFYTVGMPLRRIWPSISHQSLLVAGGSAGIAAAFNTPLGGIVFAVEELSQQHFNRFKTFLISAVIVAGLVSQWILGPYLYLGYPKLAVISFTALPWALAMGIIAGLAGALFGRGIAWVAVLTAGFLPRARVKAAILVGLLTAFGGWWAGAEAIGSGADLVTRVLFDENHTVNWWVLLGRCVEPIIANAAGGATGIFGPSLSAGAAIGSKFAELTQTPYPNLMVLLGMASFLSAVTRAPFTAFVLVLEMTDRHSAIFPLMMASLVASLVGKLVDGKSCYERRCETLLKQHGALPSPLSTKE